MIGSSLSDTNVSLVDKNGTKKIIPLLWIKSSKKPHIKKFNKTDPPPKVGILIQNTISKFSKTKNQKVPKVGILIQNTIWKFSKTKNQTKKRPPKVPKNQKHI